MTELKPCPFCGGEAAVVLDDRTWIECMDCPQKAGVGPFDTDAQAIAAWNTRAAEEAKAELVEALEFLANAARLTAGFASPMALKQADAALARVRGEG